MVPTVTSPARVYAFSPATKRRYRVVGWMFIAIGVVAACFLAGTVLANSSDRNSRFMLLLVLGISAIPILEGTIFLRGISRVSVVLSADTIRANGLLRSKSIRLADIAGKCRLPGRGGMITYLVPRPNCNAGRVRLPDDLSFDDSFNAWFASLPNLGELNEANQEIRQAGGNLHRWEQEQ